MARARHHRQFEARRPRGQHDLQAPAPVGEGPVCGVPEPEKGRPFCFNHPPYDGAPRIKATLTGSPHPREHPVADDVAASPCPECADGVLMLDPTAPSPPKLHCSTCSVLVRLPRDVRRARVSADAECAACGSKCLDVEYFAGERRLACLACEDTLRERARVARSPASAPGGRGGRGGRGRRDARR